MKGFLLGLTILHQVSFKVLGGTESKLMECLPLFNLC